MLDKDYEVLEQNNLGVVNFMNGSLNKAHYHLRKAFDIAKANIVDNFESSSREQQESGSNRQGRPRPLHRCYSTTLREDCIEMLRLTASSSCCEVLNQGIIVYASYVLVQTKQTAEGSNEYDDTSLDPSIDWTLVSAFVCFNLGLVYNAAALVSLSGNFRELRTKSIKMLESCRRLLLNACRDPGSRFPNTLLATGNPSVDWLCLGTLTKLGEASYSLSNLDIGRSYCLQLDSFIWSLQSNATYRFDSELKELLEINFSRLRRDLSALQQKDKKLSEQLLAPAA